MLTYTNKYIYKYSRDCFAAVYLSIYLCNFKQFCNTVVLYYHETHFIFHQSLWKWWSEIIYPVLVNGLGFLFLLQQNERIAWQIHIHYNNRCTAVILVRSCLIFVLIKKNILSFDKVWNEKSWCIFFPFCRGSCSDSKYTWPPNFISFLWILQSSRMLRHIWLYLCKCEDTGF